MKKDNESRPRRVEAEAECELAETSHSAALKLTCAWIAAVPWSEEGTQ
jgi:hypothetical protein